MHQQLSILLQNEVSQAQDGDLPKRAAHVELCRKLRTLINEKWDELSSDILQNQESIPGSTEDEDNFKTIMQAAGFKVGVWSNSTHNPRYGGHVVDTRHASREALKYACTLLGSSRSTSQPSNSAPPSPNPFHWKACRCA